MNLASWAIDVLARKCSFNRESISSRPRGKGMETFHWEESMAVGVSLMDVDHRKLVEILASLQHSMGQSSSRALVAATIDTLTDYTMDHFRHEEEAMRVHDYPDAETHTTEHTELMMRLRAFKDRADLGDIASALELMDFLGAYLTTHMLNADKRLGVFLRSRLAA